MTPNDEYIPTDTPIQRINEDRLSDILGDLIAEAAAPVFDEAFKIDPASMGALIPTTRAMARRQFTYASSAPKADSAVLHSLIHRGRA